MDIGGLFTYREPATRRGNSYLDQGKIQDYNATFFLFFSLSASVFNRS